MTGYQRALDDLGHNSHDYQGRRLTVEQIAERIGKRTTYLRNALCATDENHPLDSSLVVALTHATGNLALVRYFAEACGCVLLELPKVSAANVDVFEHAGDAAREFGDVMTEAARAMADGRVTKDEAQAFGVQATEAITAIARFKQLMDIKAGLAPPLSVVDGSVHGTHTGRRA